MVTTTYTGFIRCAFAAYILLYQALCVLYHVCTKLHIPLTTVNCPRLRTQLLEYWTRLGSVTHSHLDTPLLASDTLFMFGEISGI